MINNLSAPRHIRRDKWLRHGSGLKQCSWRALTIGRQHDAVRGCNMRSNILYSPKIFDKPGIHPSIDRVAADCSTVFDIEKPDEGACCFRPLCLDDPRCLSVLADTFIIKQASNEQETKAFPALSLNRLHRPEPIKINSRTRQQSRTVARYKCVFEEQLPVVLVLEKHRMRALERQPIQGFHHSCHPAIADERGPEPRNIVDHWNTASLRRQRAVNVGLDRVAKERVGPQGAKQPEVPQKHC